jgi:hypothetical protein
MLRSTIDSPGPRDIGQGQEPKSTRYRTSCCSRAPSIVKVPTITTRLTYVYVYMYYINTHTHSLIHTHIKSKSDKRVPVHTHTHSWPDLGHESRSITQKADKSHPVFLTQPAYTKTQPDKSLFLVIKEALPWLSSPCISDTYQSLIPYCPNPLSVRTLPHGTGPVNT